MQSLNLACHCFLTRLMSNVYVHKNEGRDSYLLMLQISTVACTSFHRMRLTKHNLRPWHVNSMTSLVLIAIAGDKNVVGHRPLSSISDIWQ